jgi:hypothetical protein
MIYSREIINADEQMFNAGYNVGLIKKISGFTVDIHPIDEEYESIILTMMKMSPKLILGGSIGLGILGLMKFDYQYRRPDIDFSLSEKMLEEEAILLKDFFQFEYNLYGSERDPAVASKEGTPPTFDDMRNVKFIKHEFFENTINMGPSSAAMAASLSNIKSALSIDVFKNRILLPEEILYVPYKEHIIPITHPNVILKAKIDYGYQESYSSTKHLQDLSEIHKEPQTISKKMNRVIRISSKIKQLLEEQKS